MEGYLSEFTYRIEGEKEISLTQWFKVLWHSRLNPGNTKVIAYFRNEDDAVAFIREQENRR